MIVKRVLFLGFASILGIWVYKPYYVSMRVMMVVDHISYFVSGIV